MGGTPKGLLPIDAAGTSIVAQQRQLAQQLGLDVVLVGSAGPYQAVFPDVRVIDDVPAGIGPLGGLSGVMRAKGEGALVALACDMPNLTLSLLERLLREAPKASVLASRDPSGRWDPLCARYEVGEVLPVLAEALSEGVRSFQALFARLTVTELSLSPQERKQLIDWDTPEDIGRR